MSYSVGQIHKYSVKLYDSLEAETGQNVGFKKVSNIRLARTKDRWDEFMYYAGVAETIGIKVNMLTPQQIKEIWPLCETDGIIGEVATLLARAAVHAIRTGAERIDRHVVDACGHQSPSERRRSMERALNLGT